MAQLSDTVLSAAEYPTVHIHVYNPYWLHANLGYISPKDFEKQFIEMTKVAKLRVSKSLIRALRRSVGEF